MIVLDLSPKNKESRVLSGSDNGKLKRKELGLDKKDFDNFTYEFVMPNDLFAITSSYFIACFSESIRNLGKDKFIEKYHFRTTKNSLKECIDLGINYVVKNMEEEHIIKTKLEYNNHDSAEYIIKNIENILKYMPKLNKIYQDAQKDCFKNNSYGLSSNFLASIEALLIYCDNNIEE